MPFVWQFINYMDTFASIIQVEQDQLSPEQIAGKYRISYNSFIGLEQTDHCVT